MKRLLFIIGLIGLFNDAYSLEKPATPKDRWPAIDTAQNPCHQFKKLNTAQQYFESANNRTKGCCCPNDSLTTVIAAKEYGLAVKLNPKYW